MHEGHVEEKNVDTMNGVLEKVETVEPKRGKHGKKF